MCEGNLLTGNIKYFLYQTVWSFPIVWAHHCSPSPLSKISENKCIIEHNKWCVYNHFCVLVYHVSYIKYKKIRSVSNKIACIPLILHIVASRIFVLGAIIYNEQHMCVPWSLKSYKYDILYSDKNHKRFFCIH